MESRIAVIKWFLIITLVCLGGVELLYQGLEYFVFKTPAVIDEVEKEKEPVVADLPTDDSGKVQKPDYKVILQRNLFGSYKKEEAPREEEGPKEEEAELASELNLVLMGTVSGTENSRRAIILNKQTREQEIYSAGEVIEGALIEEIKRGEILLTVDGTTKRLDMSEAADMRPAYKPPPTQAANKANVNTKQRRVRPVAASPRTPRRRVVRRPSNRNNTPAAPE